MAELRGVAVGGGLALALVLGGGGAVAAKLITGKQIKDGSVASKDIKDGTVTSKDVKDNSLGAGKLKDGAVGLDELKDDAVGGAKLKDGAVGSKKIKDGAVGSDNLAAGSVTADKLAPGAVAFPNSLWGTVLRHQSGAARSQLQAGPAGAPLGQGSLRLFVSGPSDTAAFGNSFDFAGMVLADITSASYATYSGDSTPLTRPSLRIEIDPHLVSDAAPGGAIEFTTLVHQPPAGPTGWVRHAAVLADDAWYLTGDEGTTTGCTQAATCTYAEVVSALATSPDADAAPAAISTGLYFGLGSGVGAATDTAVDALVIDDFEFDFEATGVFLRPA